MLLIFFLVHDGAYYSKTAENEYSDNSRATYSPKKI